MSLTPRIHFETTLVSIQKEGKLETAVSLALKPLRFQNESNFLKPMLFQNESDESTPGPVQATKKKA